MAGGSLAVGPGRPSALSAVGAGLIQMDTHLCCPPNPVARRYLDPKHHRSSMSSRQRSASVHTTCTRVRKRVEKCSKRVRKGTCTHAACPPSCQPAPAPTRTCAHARPRACPPAHLPTRLPTYPPAEDESMKMKGKGSMNLAYTQLPLLFMFYPSSVHRYNTDYTRELQDTKSP